MSNLPKVSVVMPIFNTRQTFVHEAISSLVNQTCSDWELVVVEDPSDLLSTDRVREFNDDRIHYVLNHTRTSLIEQRNKAVSLCKAPLVAMLDADDVAHPERLDAQMAFLNQHLDVSVLGCQLTIIDASTKEIAVRDYPTSHEAIGRSREQDAVHRSRISIN